MAACFTPRSRSRALRFRLFSLALSLPRTLHISSGALSRSNTASLVQETLSCQLDIRSPFLLDQSLLKVPVFERMIQVANTTRSLAHPLATRPTSDIRPLLTWHSTRWRNRGIGWFDWMARRNFIGQALRRRSDSMRSRNPSGCRARGLLSRNLDIRR